MSTEHKRDLGKVFSKDTLVKIEKFTDGVIFFLGAVFVATGVPAMVALGSSAAIYSGVQYTAVDRATSKSNK